MKKTSLFFSAIIILSALSFYACSNEVVRLDVTPSMVIHYFESPDDEIQTIDAGAYFDIEYTWKLGPGFKAPDKNYRAFVHFRDSTGNLLSMEKGKTVQDDHDFPVPISQWKAGEDIVYTRKRIKFDDNLGTKYFLVNMYIGIYDPDDMRRAILNGGDEESQETKSYLMGTFRIRRNNKIYPRFDNSWHGPEPAPNEKHRWSKKISVATFPRDKRTNAVQLWLAGHSPVEDIEATEQKLWIYIHERKPEFLVTKEPFILKGERLSLTSIAIGPELYESYTDRDIRLIFEVDQTMKPTSDDERDVLGFRVQELLLQPMNSQN